MAVFLLRTLILALACASPTLAAPRIFYTDILTGPNTGGEDNHGAYLTLFGSGFGAVRGGSTVTINTVPVASYKQWTDTKITVQPGAAVTSGTVRVMVGGTSSNVDHIFTVVAGDIYFVAHNGNDTSGVIGDITRPFRTIQATLDRADFGPGDYVVVRGDADWTDMFPLYDSFFSIYGKSGSPGAPLVVMGYPTETVNLMRTTHLHGIHSWNTSGHFVIANFRLNAAGHGVGIGLVPRTTDVRVVNNEVFGFFENSGGSAAISGSGKQYRIFGNHVHDNSGSKLYHALYFDARDTSGVDDIEIAYNHIHDQSGGRGIQIYGDTGTRIDNVHIHHNLIHDISLDAILFGDDTGVGAQVYSNVVYRASHPALHCPVGVTDCGSSGSCLRFNSTQVAAEIYNNTFYDCAMDGSPDSAGVHFQRAASVAFANNIVYTSGRYASLSVPTSAVNATNNVWFGAGAAPAWGGTNAVTNDPLFADASLGNLRLRTGSPAINAGSAAAAPLVTRDFDGNLSPQAGVYDIGAFESSGLPRPNPPSTLVVQ